MIWGCFLLLIAIGFLVLRNKPASSYLHRTIHTRIYSDIVRPVRLGLLAVGSYLKAAGIDVFHDCVVENPVLRSTEQCVCMHTKEATEVTLDGSVLPFSVYENPKEICSEKCSGFKTQPGAASRFSHISWKEPPCLP